MRCRRGESWCHGSTLFEFSSVFLSTCVAKGESWKQELEFFCLPSKRQSYWWMRRKNLISASWIQAQELHMVTAPCAGSASLAAMGFESINEQLNLIKAAKPISVTRLRFVPVALGFPRFLGEQRRGFNTHHSAPRCSVGLLGEDLKSTFVFNFIF